MIYQIEDKEAKAKYIRKIMEQSSKSKNYVSLSNAYRFKYIMQQFQVQEPVTIQDLQTKIKQIKIQTEELKDFTQHLDFKIQNIENQKAILTPQTSEDLDIFLNSMTIVQKQRRYTKITLKINPDFQSTFIALIDSGVDLNCIMEGLIPIVYFIKTSQRQSTTSNVPLKVHTKYHKVMSTRLVFVSKPHSY